MADIRAKRVGAFAVIPKKSSHGTIHFHAAVSVTIFQDERRLIHTHWALSPISNIHLEFECAFDGDIRYQDQRELGVYIENNTLAPLIIERGQKVCEMSIYRQVIDRMRKRKKEDIPIILMTPNELSEFREKWQ